MTVRLRLRPTLIALATALLIVPCASARGIGLQPAAVEMEVTPGTLSNKLVTVANVDPGRAVSVSLRLADWSQARDGEVQVSPPGETEGSAAKWVTLRTTSVTLRPGESRQVAIDMLTPADTLAPAEYRFALIASAVLPDASGGKAGAWKRQETSSLFYLTAGNPGSSPEIIASRLTAAIDGKSAIGLEILNDGEAHARLEGVIEVSGTAGLSETIPVSNLVVLGGGVRDVVLPLTRPLPANPVIEVRFDNAFAPQEPTGAEHMPAHRVTTDAHRADVAAGWPGQP